ncbi:hypothetical protein [Parapedobacter koreensis]|nr:hypothetical protein [Parapedobacter koreensis]
MKTAIKCFGILLFSLGPLHAAHAQQGFGTANPNPNSVIDLTATDKGLLLPRLALQATNLANPLGEHVAGMLVYNTAINGTGATAVTPGFYSNNGTKWVRVDITVSNGLHIETDEDYEDTQGHVKLGGDLTKPTEITTDEDNTLAITGLQAGDPDDDRIVMVNPTNGVLKSVSSNKFVRFFYMPSVVFDTSTPNPTGPPRTRNLYQEYIDQFTGDGDPDMVKNPSAPDEIPFLPQATDLHYYITYYDKDVFGSLSIDDNGVLSYRVIGPGTPMSFMNIVFVIKGEED